MSLGRISCSCCGRSWPLSVTFTPYVELELQAQPCPACEAVALGCQSVEGVGLGRAAVRRPRPGLPVLGPSSAPVPRPH